MYGWRGKFGFINPSICDSVLLEFYHMLPEGILVTPADLKVQNLTDEEFKKEVINKILEAAKIVDYEEVQAIIVGGTPPITKMGFEVEKEIIEKVEAQTKKPSSTTPTAEVDALRFLGLKRIALVSPYVEALNQHLKSYLEYRGFEVVAVSGLGIVKNAHLTKVSFDTAYTLSKETFLKAKGSVDGIFLSCPRWPTVRCIAPLERDLSVPVVSTAQALVWKALSLLNIHEVKPGFGRLFKDFEMRS